MILDLVVFGHAALRESAGEVTIFGDSLVEFIKDLRDTMRAAQGVGLAAPQVDYPDRVAVIDVDGQKLDLVNPRIIIATGPKTLGEEGCLSIPDVFGMVPRYEYIEVATQDPGTGEKRLYKVTGFMARAIQHEIDHLDGRLFIDYLGEFKRRQALGAWAKQARHYPGNIRKL